VRENGDRMTLYDRSLTMTAAAEILGRRVWLDW
jgi:hypothetical protein